MKLISLLQTTFNLASWLVLIIFVIFCLYTLGSNTTLFGRYRSYLVLSGSMEPTIRINDIIVVGQRPQYFPLDVITFTNDNHLITHRVVESLPQSGSHHYLTKGDANRSQDEGQVDQSAVIGKVVLVIPRLGHFVSFAQSPYGLVILIVTPLVGLLLDLIVKWKHA